MSKIQHLPVVDLDNVNHRRRQREVTNSILKFEHDDSRVQTSQEKLAGKTPVNPSYPIGDIRRWGASSGQDCTKPIQDSLDTSGLAIIPENFTAFISSPINMAGAGWILRGKSRWTSIIKLATGYSASNMVEFSASGSSTCYGISVSDIRFQIYTPVVNYIDVTAVNLASVNNATVQRCRFEGVFSDDGTGDDKFSDYLAVGVVFNDPLSSGSYNNNVIDCDGIYLRVGVLYGNGANANNIRGGELLHCATAIDAAPASGVDTVFVSGTRIEGCDIGIKEGSSQANYVRVRFEDQETADITFTTASVDCLIVGGSTATTPTPLVNMGNANGLNIYSPDLYGMYVNQSSTSRPNTMIGPNIFGQHGDTGTGAYPTGVGSCGAYFRSARTYIDNNIDHCARNNAGTGTVFMMRADTSDRILLGAAGEDVRFGRALIALGGGAAPTFGTIGGSGPATAAQNTWMKFFDSGGNPFYVPCWK